MALRQTLFRKSGPVLLVLAIIAATACTQTPTKPAGPTIALSTNQIRVKGFLQVKGSGFTPKTELASHLKKPTGEEYPVLLMLTDDKGEITHEIDTLLLMIGAHELWIVDSKTGTASNRIRFEVTPDTPPAR